VLLEFEAVSCSNGGLGNRQRANIRALQQLLLFTWHCQVAMEVWSWVNNDMSLQREALEDTPFSHAPEVVRTLIKWMQAAPLRP
jgi:hypothetical protein